MLDLYTETYDKLLLAGEFNLTGTESVLDEFLYVDDFNCIVNDKICFKNFENPSCIDLFLTNFSSSFHNTIAICTIRLSQNDCHRAEIYVCQSEI